jgi:hypothetical protein
MAKTNSTIPRLASPTAISFDLAKRTLLALHVGPPITVAVKTSLAIQYVFSHPRSRQRRERAETPRSSENGPFRRSRLLPLVLGFCPTGLSMPKTRRGCNSDKTQLLPRSFTPVLHHCARRDSRTRTTTRGLTGRVRKTRNPLDEKAAHPDSALSRPGFCPGRRSVVPTG